MNISDYLDDVCGFYHIWIFILPGGRKCKSTHCKFQNVFQQSGFGWNSVHVSVEECDQPAFVL